jgi:hypothetical protein
MKLLTASLLVAAGGFIVLGTTTYATAATLVDIELAFIIDGSDSVSLTNFETQKQSYYNIFRNDFYADIVQPLAGRQLRPGQTGIGKIAVALYQFGQRLGSPDDCSFNTVTGRNECTAVDWIIIASQADANSFADRISGPTTGLQKIGGLTAMGAGITQATSGFTGYNMAGITNNSIDSVQQVFDLASDGFDIPPPTVPSLIIRPVTAAEAALAAGVDVLNTIGSPTDINNEELLTDLRDVFAANTNLNGTPPQIFDPVILGQPYQDVLNNKIVQETQPLAESIPEPSFVLGLLSLGLLGIGSKLIRR